MARNATNKLLHKAKESKSDEFYTLFEDIERELRHYEGQFAGKVVYCNCDDARVSNFYKFFHKNFKRFGLHRLIASCYCRQASDLFEAGAEKQAFSVEFDGETEVFSNLRGNGDFRSMECTNLLDRADIVVTNPPFSLFREFVGQIVRHKKQFLLIGNINAITYKEIFELIQNNQAWLGVNLGRGISGFIVPENYELYGSETKIDGNGNRIVSSNNCLWLTNLKTPTRSQFIELTKTYAGNESHYPKYDNYEGINIDKTQDIPKDYKGVMGVPITFLHKYNPSQFEIVKFRKGNDDKDLSISGKCPYFRILIRSYPSSKSGTLYSFA